MNTKMFKYFFWTCLFLVPLILLMAWQPLAGLILIGMLAVWMKNAGNAVEELPSVPVEEIEKELPEVVEDGTPAGVVTEDQPNS